MADQPQSGEFTTDQKIQALQQAFATGAITQAQYDTQYAVLTGATPEQFSLAKFLEGMLSVLNPVNWAKDIASFFNIRVLLIFLALIGAFCWGLRDRIPIFNLGPGSLQGKTFTIDLGAQANNEQLRLNGAGQLQVLDSKGKVVKNVRVKDIPELNAAIKPVGFQLKPIAVAGMGYGTNNQGIGAEVGAGVSWFKLYALEADTFATNKAIYPVGVSYRLTKFAGGNTSIGLAPGIGYHGDKRIMAYVRITF